MTKTRELLTEATAKLGPLTDYKLAQKLGIPLMNKAIISQCTHNLKHETNDILKIFSVKKSPGIDDINFTTTE